MLKIKVPKIGGRGRNRTDDKGFAGLCITTLLPSHISVYLYYNILIYNFQVFLVLFFNFYVIIVKKDKKMITNLFQQKFFNVDESISSPSDAAYKDIKEKITTDHFPQIAAIYDEQEIENIKNLAQKLQNYQKIVVIGVGGSSLGGKTFNKIGKKQQKVDFLESIDPNTIKEKISQLNLSDTFFIVISKSGNTIETICQTLILIEEFKEKNLSLREKFLFITQNHQNPIAEIAKSIDCEIYKHPEDIGGRFSCFSVVGLLPAILSGLDINKIIFGARNIVQDFIDNPGNNIIKAASIQSDLFDRNIRGNVMMPYIDKLKRYTDWYRQLWAESLGKNGFGSVPINSLGTVDQHSQLQLYLDGPKDKFFTFFANNNHNAEFTINDLPTVKTLFGNKNLSDIVAIEAITTIDSLIEKNCPVRVFEIDEMNEETLSALMMHMFLEVILLAKIRNIDPFDQPEVEKRKVKAKSLLQKL